MKKISAILILISLVITSLALPQDILRQSQIKTGPYPVSLTPELIDQAYEYYEKYGKTDISDKLNRIQPVPVGGTQYFWAMAPDSKQFYKVEAVLKKITEHCYIYVEKGQNINDDTIDKFAYEFDNIIYPTNHKYFGTEAKPGVDFDERLTMLFLDIKDGYDPAASPGYVAGYFFPLNQYSTKVFEYSNEREMIYIDTYPSDPSSQMTYSVIAHEFQHMQHWNMSPKEKIWINEACSQLAMRLCGYEHPNQILAYMKNPDLSLTAWAKDVMLENYGAVYLFFYYMVTKYFPENYADFTLNLVKNQTPGVAGINEVLKKNGIKKTTEQIFEEWAITNVLNIEGTPYFYDKTISQMTLNPSKVHVADTAGKIKEKALSFGSHYIQFSYNVPFLPTFPSFIDKITIMDKEAVNIKWGVNNWNLPINDYIPQGSYIENSFIVTPLVNNGDKNKTEIGPFRKPGIQNIKTVNFVFEYKDGSISKPYEIPVCDPSFAENTGDTLKINFDGSGSFFGNIFGKPDFNVYIAKFDSADAKNTLKVEKIKLDSSKKSEILIENYGTLYDTVILIPLNTGKDGSYEYSSELISTSKSEKQITEIVEMLKKSAMNSFINNDIDNYLKILDRFEILKNSHNIDINPLISSKSDDSDTSHSNINYLLAKNHEALHALSHLKIDPVYVEGQLKQILQLLEINLNFPHIPFPDGLALKNYNIKTSLEFSDMLKNKTVTEKDKELLVRLTMAQNYIEQTYNMGLLLAEDTTLSIFKIILLFTHSTEIISGILDNFTDSPVLGSIAGPVKNMLIEKITIAFQRVIKLAASKMPSPYNSIVPVASDIMTKILFKVMKIEPSSNDGISAGFMKELAVKTAGKYILSSIPKIGYVDLTQKNLETAVNYANSGKINGTLSNAAQKVQNNLSTTDSYVKNTLNQCAKNREYAGIANAISNVTAVTSLIDPTSISQILTVVGKITSGGFMAYSVGLAGNGYYRYLPSSNNAGITNAFLGGRTFENNHNSQALKDRKNMVINSAIEWSRFSAVYERKIEILDNLIENKNIENIKYAVSDLLEEDKKLSDSSDSLYSYLTLSDSLRNNEDVDEILANLDVQLNNQTKLLYELLMLDVNYSRNKEISNRNISLISENIRKTSGIINSKIASVTNIENINMPDFINIHTHTLNRNVKKGEVIELNFNLVNTTDNDLRNISVKISSTHNLIPYSPKLNTNLSAYENSEYKVKFKILPEASAGLASITIETEKENLQSDLKTVFLKIIE